MSSVGVYGPAGMVRNYLPGQYRGVSFTQLDCSLDLDSLRRCLIGRPAYRRTRFIVARNGSETAVLKVTKAGEEAILEPIVEVELLAGPAECAFVVQADVDTAVPSAVARVAVDRAPDVAAVVVQGRYAHVTFIVNADPLTVLVRDVVPPEPAKLFDQASRVLELAERLPPIRLMPDIVRLTDLAAAHPAAHYLVPCRGGGLNVDGATTSYLDEHPTRADWTLLGCSRSREIHRAFYGDEPESVEMCPYRTRPAAETGARPAAPVLTKCCQYEDDILVDEFGVTVPWGATPDQIADGLAALAQRWEPTWRPA